MRRRFSLIVLTTSLAACAVLPRSGTEEPSAGVPGEGYGAAAESSSANSEGPFIVEAQQQSSTGTAVTYVMKPGVPYLQEHPQGSVPCMADPVADVRGKLTYPVSQTYAHLPMLGQLLTAHDCGPKRTEEMQAVTKGRYTAGSAIWLKAAPSWQLRETLRDIGFACMTNATVLDCKRWQVTKPVDTEDMARLIPFVGEMEKEFCTSCW